MGKLGYVLGKGLQSAGQEWQKIEAQKQEQARYDEQQKLKTERHEAELNSMDIRNEQLTLSNNLKKVELNNKRITTIFSQTNGAAGPVTDAITKYGNGHVEQYDKLASEQATKDAGGKMGTESEIIITHNGVWETNDKDVPITDPQGNKVFKAFDGGAGTITRTRPEWSDHVGRILNPSNALAAISRSDTYKEIYNKFSAQYAAKAEAVKKESQTPAGVVEQKTKEAELKIKENKAKGVGQEAPPASYENLQGKQVSRTHTEAQGDLASMKIIAQNHPEWGVKTAAQAYRIGELSNNKDFRKGLADDIQKALQDPTGKYGEKLVRDGAMKMRVPEAMLRDMIKEASLNKEVIESKSGGMLQWLKDFLSGGGEKAPAIYKDEQAGGLS